ncbi:MAG: Trk system potassium transporter TrkA [Fibrobacterota bacterium]
MNILVIGAGTVGYNLASHLSAEVHKLTVLDVSDTKLEDVTSLLDVKTVSGDCVSTSVLKESGAAGADLVISVTETDEVNLISAMFCKKLGAKQTIARVRNREYFREDAAVKRSEWGIDLLINPENEAAEEILHLLEKPYASDITSLSGHVEILSWKITRNSPLLDRTLMEIAAMFSFDFRIVLIQRDNSIIVPKGRTGLKENDHIYLIAPAKKMDTIAEQFGLYTKKPSRVIICGNTDVATRVAEGLDLKNNIRTKFICSDQDMCRRLTDMYKSILILNGDLTDKEFLESENIKETDVFMALSDNEEENLLSCLLAKSLGVRKVISLVIKPDYIPLISRLEIDSIVSQRLTTTGRILKYVRSDRVLFSATVANNSAELLEFLVSKKSKATKKPIMNLKFPDGAIIGAVIRDGIPSITTGSTLMKPGDHVVVIAEAGCVKQVENFF